MNLRLPATKTGKFLKRYFNPKLVEAWSMTKDPQTPEILWFGTENNGIFKFNKKTEKFTAYKPDGTNSILLHILGVHADNDGNLWFTNESNGLIRYDRKKDSFSSYKHNKNNPKSINSNHINYFFVSADDTIWVSSQRGLNKFDKDTETFESFEEEAGISSNIRGILEDNNGFLWISSDFGLLKFDTSINKVVRRYEEGGLKYNFSPLSFLKTTDGEMWFSSSLGVIRFDPDMVKDNPLEPPVYLTSITRGGEKINRNTAPEKVRKIELDWKHNFFEFEYVALNYTRPEKNQYAYMLEGFDKEWYNAGQQRFGRYSGLPGGQYILRVKGANNDGVWNNKGTSLKIVVASPWWKTRVFYWSAGSFVVILILCWYLIRIRTIQTRNIILEKRVKEKTRELQEALDNIKTLKGLVPICANCKKIRDDKGYWNHLELYIEKHSNAQFSHGICGECSEKLYGELLRKDKG